MLLKAFPGEILFSRLCRSLSVSGMPVRKFTRSLGLETNSSFHPLLTQHLPEIAEISHENPRLLWSEQTMFPLWVWSMPGYAKALRQLTSSPARLRWFNQITGNHTSQRMKLHFCPVCSREDAMEYGVPYWHCEHQIPGVNICKHHHCRLISRLVPASPHIAAEFYPDQFNNITPGENIENDFSAFACQILTHLSHDEKISDNYFSDFPPTRTHINNQNHSENEKIYISLNDLIKHLWEDNSDPVIHDKLRFLYYIISNYENIPPTQKLLLMFYLLQIKNINQKTNQYYEIKNQKNKKELNCEIQKSILEINSMMIRLWPSTKFIIEFRN